MIEDYLNAHPERAARFRQVFRFGIVGTVSSVIHYGVYCLVLLMANANIAYTIGYLTGFVCNYFLTTFFTFSSRPTTNNALGFSFSHLVNYLLEIGLLNLFLWFNVDKWLAPILVMAIAVPINFLILHFVYMHKKKNNETFH